VLSAAVAVGVVELSIDRSKKCGPQLPYT
jgi:hypothetical protein